MGKGGGGGSAAAADTEGIRVAVRVRPFLPHEAGSSSCVEVNGDTNQISIGRSDRSTRHLLESSQGGGATSATAKPRKTFTFDHALAGNTPQNDVYDSCVSSLVASCLEGFNATTLACELSRTELPCHHLKPRSFVRSYVVCTFVGHLCQAIIYFCAQAFHKELPCHPLNSTIYLFTIIITNVPCRQRR